MDAYPYIVSNNKIEPILAKIRSAARPQRVTGELLKKWGFTASNDRAMLRILKSLGFLDENGVPTEEYDRLRDHSAWRQVLAERIRNAYADLFAIDERIQAAPESEIRGAMSRVTGKDETSVSRYFATFRSLATLADFDGNAPSAKPQRTLPPKTDRETESEPAGRAEATPPISHAKASLHYNIQIHLPATTDVSVYNAIFKSLREHLIA